MVDSLVRSFAPCCGQNKPKRRHFGKGPKERQDSNRGARISKLLLLLFPKTPPVHRPRIQSDSVTLHPCYCWCRFCSGWLGIDGCLVCLLFLVGPFCLSCQLRIWSQTETYHMQRSSVQWPKVQEFTVFLSPRNSGCGLPDFYLTHCALQITYPRYNQITFGSGKYFQNIVGMIVANVD